MFYNSCVCKLVSVRGCKSVKALSSNLVYYVKQACAYSKKIEPDPTCCKPIDQTEGRQVEPWPRCPPTTTSCESPVCPEPANNDPYKIKVPEVVVPPLPETNVKQWPMTSRKDHIVYQNHQNYPGHQYPQQMSPQQTPTSQPFPYQSSPANQEAKAKEEEREGFLGLLKGFFKGKKKGDDSIEKMTCHNPQLNLVLPNEETGIANTSEVKFGNESVIREIFQKSMFLHPDNWNEKLPRKIQYSSVNYSRLGYHGKSKYNYAFIEPWKPLDRVTLLAKAEQEEAVMLEQSGLKPGTVKEKLD